MEEELDFDNTLIFLADLWMPLVDSLVCKADLLFD